MLVSGAKATPALKLQRPRALISLRKRLTLEATSSGHAAGQHSLEVTHSEIVLPLEEERARQLQPYPHQPRRLHKHCVERGDGLVQQQLALIVGAARPLGCLQRGQAVEEERVGPDPLLLKQRAQDDDRLLEAAGIHQRLRLIDADGARLPRRLRG